MQPPSYAKKRAFERYKIPPTICHLASGGKGACLLINLSLIGVYLLKPDPPPLGSTVVLRFSHEPLEGYRLPGKVVRHDGLDQPGFGLRFFEPHPRLLRAVRYAPD